MSLTNYSNKYEKYFCERGNLHHCIGQLIKQMKKILRVMICALLSGLLCISCIKNDENNTSKKDIKNALKINVYEYEKDTNTDTLKTLELNQPVAVRCYGNGTTNFNIQFCYEGGICEVTAENEDIQLSKGQDIGPWKEGDLGDNRVYGYSFGVGDGGYLAAIPLGSDRGFFNVGKQPEIQLLKDELESSHNVGREYSLTVKAKDYDTTVITAELKFTQLTDSFSDNKDYIGDFTIELVSYEYSYIYDMMQ